MPLTRREALISAGVLAGSALAGDAARQKATDAANARTQGDPVSTGQVEPTCLADYEAAAKQKIPHTFWEFYNGSCG